MPAQPDSAKPAATSAATAQQARKEKESEAGMGGKIVPVN